MSSGFILTVWATQVVALHNSDGVTVISTADVDNYYEVMLFLVSCVELFLKLVNLKLVNCFYYILTYKEFVCA
jgi:hypothetical protein